MAGIVIGIPFRIRAFLYAGVPFLVLNVRAQLIEFYPEQRWVGRVVADLGGIDHWWPDYIQHQT